MTQKPTGGPAFPQSDVLYEDGCELVRTQHGGMTLREYAAIKLRVPDSGTDWLDDMIREARRMDYAGQALAGIIAHPSNQDNEGGAFFARMAYAAADAMLAAREASE
jgi:hypothetical protein